MSEVILNDSNFENEVLKSSIPVLVDFWAAWCGPCKQIAPMIEELASEYAGRIKVGKLNIDDGSKIADTYGIVSIPTLLLFKNGDVVEKLIGAHPKHVLDAMLKKNQ